MPRGTSAHTGATQGKVVSSRFQAVSPLPNKTLATASSTHWMRVNKETVRKHFEAAVAQVEAYKKFLTAHNVTPRSVRATGVQRIPPITKRNYLRAYPWESLCVKGALSREPLVLTTTSGSTGEPFYIPRTDDLHEASMLYHRLFMERSGLNPKKSTLVVVTFGMGVWIGGMLTYEAFRRISEHGWSLTLLTPGVNKKEIFDALLRVGPAYEQVVLCGYPPFIKDVLEEGAARGVQWKNFSMRIVCAAEGFSEQFRDHLLKLSGAKDPYRSIMNIYGSAELGTMASETPLAILLRRLALAHDALYAKLFSEASRLPTLAQFVPTANAFEAGDEGEVYVTGGSALPFVRYDIGDHGGVLSYDEVVRACEEVGIDLRKEARKAGILDTLTALPFVYVYERKDLSTKLYGAIIYPEHVKQGFQAAGLEKYVTGRFTLSTETDAAHEEYLEIQVELRPGVTDGENIRARLVESVVEHLRKASSEYENNLASFGEKVIPRLVFWQHEEPTYFAPGIKQKWVRRRVLKT